MMRINMDERGRCTRRGAAALIVFGGGVGGLLA